MFIAVHRPPQRCVAKAIARLDVRARIDQRLGYLDVSAACGHVERRAMFHAIGSVHIRARAGQNADDRSRPRNLALIAQAVQGRMSAAILSGWVQAKAQEEFH